MIKVCSYTNLILFFFLLCDCYCLNAAEKVEKIDEIIRGNSYKEVRVAFDSEIVRCNKEIGRVKLLEKKYPDDPMFAKNREDWERRVESCKEQFYKVVQELFKSYGSTAITTNTFASLKDKYREKTSQLDEHIEILRRLKVEFPQYDWETLINGLMSMRQRFKDTYYICPEHHPICENCISQEENCKACGGKGYWVGFGWIHYPCMLCNATGRICAPGKTYCAYCHGIPNVRRVFTLCDKCKRGLVPCPSHTPLCPVCGTENGGIKGQKLEP